MRPKSINLFEKLGWGASALGGVTVFVMFIQALTQRVVTGAAPYFLMLFVLLLFGALAFVTYYGSRRRHDLGRWGFSVCAAVIAVLLVTRINDLGRGGEGMALLYLVLDMVTLAAMMGATIFLLQPDSHGWFALGPIQPAPRPVAQPSYLGYGAPPHTQYPGQPGQPGQPGYPPQDYPPQPGYSQPVYPPQPYPPAQAQPGYPPEGAPPAAPDPSGNPPRQ